MNTNSDKDELTTLRKWPRPGFFTLCGSTLSGRPNHQALPCRFHNLRRHLRQGINLDEAYNLGDQLFEQSEVAPVIRITAARVSSSAHPSSGNTTPAGTH